MAEINIEKKKTNPLVWIIALLVVLALLWWLFNSRRTPSVVGTAADTAAVMTAPAAGGTAGTPAPASGAPAPTPQP